MRLDDTAEIVPGEHDFFRRFERRRTDRSVFEAQEDEHGEIDLRLVEKIEALLVPVLGRWEQSSTWFHQMDYYGDGVRALNFRSDSFPREHLSALKALLTGEHEPFAILCVVVESLLSTGLEPSGGPKDQYLALFSRGVLVTQGLADTLPLGT